MADDLEVSGDEAIQIVSADNQADARLENDENHAGEIEYLDKDGSIKYHKMDEDLADADDHRETLESGWYCVSRDKLISSIIDVHGDVNLVLCDGATFECRGLIVNAGNSITIYGQSEKSGYLKALASKYGGDSPKWFFPGIGGELDTAMGDITICSGKILAEGGRECAGIGTSGGSSGGTITIWGGEVSALGGCSAAGIGGGNGCSGGNIEIWGGTIDAKSLNDGAGIGGGFNGDGGTIRIHGGVIWANTVDYFGDGAAIGGGFSGNGCDELLIENARVTALSEDAAAIGGGAGGLIDSGGHGGKVIIRNADVTANSLYGGSGIGGGGLNSHGIPDAGNGGDVTIEGNSNVHASSGSGGAIGGGVRADHAGQVHLSDDLCVSSADDGTLAFAPDRELYCKYRKDVTVRPCAHSKLTYDFSLTLHKKRCVNCNGGDFEGTRERHHFVNGVCTECGYTDEQFRKLGDLVKDSWKDNPIGAN